MNDNSASNCTFHIYGGNNQILPNATEAVQNFYGDEFAKQKLAEENNTTKELSEDEQALSIYINKVEALRGYVSLLRSCQSAHALAEVVATMCQQEPGIDETLIVKQSFINLLLPFLPEWDKGQSIDNIRVAINNAWSARKKSFRRQ